MTEIERKFLVLNNAYKAEASTVDHIIQGFLCRHPERTVRVRIKEKIGLLTVKGLSNKSGTSRFEWEKEIDREEAQQLLEICEKGVIEKLRYAIKVEDHIFEVDEFLGDNKGLIIAEVELQHEDQSFPKPSWLGEEVTGDIKYYNSQISKKPFKSWNT